MKNLKKLSVVLFATLLSFNFTSCIDDGVSDAVDQVYLAQAEFLRANATLKAAEAQHELALAAVQNADAAYKDALTRGQDILNNYNEENYQQTLDLAAAVLLVNLEKQLGFLEQAKSANEVAMIAYLDAVAKAKNTALTALALDYSGRITNLDAFYVTKITLEHKIAIRELYLNDDASTTTIAGDGDLHLAFIKNGLINDLAELNAGLIAAQNEITRLEALTPEDGRAQTTALQADKAALGVLRDALGVDLAEKENLFTVAKTTFDAIASEKSDINTAQNAVDAAKLAIKNHIADSLTATKAITKANANITALLTPVPALVVVDTTTAFNGLAAQDLVIATKLGLVGTANTAATTAEDAWKAAVTKQDSADYYLGLFKAIPNSSVQVADAFSRLINWEMKYTATQTVLDGYVPTTGTAALLSTANTTEALAYAAWVADAGGSIEIDAAAPIIAPFMVDDLGELGISTDGIANPKTYMRVATWSPVVGGSIPATFYPTKYDVAAIAAISTGAFPISAGVDPNEAIAANTDMILWEQNGTATDIAGGATTLVNGGANNLFITNAEALNAITVPGNVAITTAYFLEVEADDTAQTKYAALTTARAATLVAEANHTAATSGLAGVTADRDEALAYVGMAYDAFGLTFPDALLDPVADMTYFTDFQTLATADVPVQLALWKGTAGAYVVYPATPAYVTAIGTSALKGVYDAEKAHAQAIADKGIDFRNAWTGNSWTTRFSEWYANAATANVLTYTSFTSIATGVYEPLEEQVGPDNTPVTGDWARAYDLPHTGTSITSYEALRNAYFQMVWAMETVDANTAAYNALKTLAYTRIDPATASAMYTNDKVIEYATADIAHIDDLLVADREVLAMAQTELDRLIAAANYDPASLLWDHSSATWTVVGNDNNTNPGGGTGTSVNHVNPYLPALANLLNAEIARDAVVTAMAANKSEQDQIDNLIAHVQFFLVDNRDTTSATDIENVETFMKWIEGEVEYQKFLINGGDDPSTAAIETADGLLVSIEKMEVSIEKADITKEDADAAITDMKRQLVNLMDKIAIYEASAASILARMLVLTS